MTDIDQSRLDLFATEHAVHGDRIRALQIDATDEDAIRGAVSEVVEVHGQLDVVIANAGGGAGGSVTETSTDDWHRTIALNLDSLFYVARAGLPNLTASGGSIVATASSSGLNGWPHQAAYVAAKAGVVNLVRSMAIDYAAEGVRVNAVAPGPTMTPAVEEHLRTSPGTQAGYEDRIPMGRLGRPDEIVAAALFLASSAASYVTGVTIPVDGGLTAWTALVRVGAILTAIALGAFPALASDGASWWAVVAARIFLMAGLGTMMAPLVTEALSSLPDHLHSHGSAIVTTIQQVAGAFGIALFVTVATLTSATDVESPTPTASARRS